MGIARTPYFPGVPGLESKRERVVQHPPVTDGPFLSRPFDGDFACNGAFDHDPAGTGAHRQLTAWDTVTWGHSGHPAWDFALPTGTPVLAAVDGVVSRVAEDEGIRC